MEGSTAGPEDGVPRQRRSRRRAAGFGLASVGMLFAQGPESSQRGRSDGKRGLAQGWTPLQEQERRLLRVLECGPERTLFRGLELTLLRALARNPLRHQDLRLLRYEGRVRFRTQVQHRNRVLLGFEYRGLVRRPSMEPELLPLRWLERLRFPALCRPQERCPFRGQGLPPPSRGREFARAKPEVRS